MPPCIPQRNRELPIQVINESFAVLFIQVNDDFSVGLRIELVALLDQFVTQFNVVKNFAVEHHLDGPILVVNRLLASRKIDDAQARVGESNRAINQYAGSVRTTMMQARDHCGKFGTLRRLTGRVGQNSCDAAHVEKALVK